MCSPLSPLVDSHKLYSLAQPVSNPFCSHTQVALAGTLLLAIRSVDHKVEYKPTLRTVRAEIRGFIRFEPVAVTISGAHICGAHICGAPTCVVTVWQEVDLKGRIPLYLTSSLMKRSLASLANVREVFQRNPNPNSDFQSEYEWLVGFLEEVVSGRWARGDETR